MRVRTTEEGQDRKGRQGRVGALIRAVCTGTCGPLENPVREASEVSIEFVRQKPSSLFRSLRSSSSSGASSLVERMLMLCCQCCCSQHILVEECPNSLSMSVCSSIMVARMSTKQFAEGRFVTCCHSQCHLIYSVKNSALRPKGASFSFSWAPE
jgi:hypothetical protein